MDILTSTTEPPLLDRLKQMLAYSDRADIAVGYLFISGFNTVAEELGRLKRARVLVGRTDKPTIEEIARGVQQAEALQAIVEGDGLIRRSARAELGVQAVQTIAQGVALLPQCDDTQDGVCRLSNLIAGGSVEIKTYPKGVLHAKAYLCWYKDHAEPGSAIVGSSNFTLAGFTGNTELNVRVTGDAEMAALRDWFDALWDDAVDVTQDVAVQLRNSWALARTPPYHVYLKALYELYRDELETPELEPRRHGAPDLANFQLDAVRRGLSMVRQHGGCFIGDVVGLGKTYIGAELVRQLQYEEPRGTNPLIVCPAGLQPMWHKINEQFGLGAAIVSMSALAPPAGAQFDEERGAYVDAPAAGHGIDMVATYPHRGVVLVDEVHNFRNPAAARYQALAHYLAGGDHKVVLLSATPQNLGPADIYYQLRLFLDDLEHGLDLEPVHLQDYFRAVQRWYEFDLEQANYQQELLEWRAAASRRGVRRPPAPTPPRPPAIPRAAIEEVLRPTFIRRRRKDISELYGDSVEVAGRRVIFPEPTLDNLFYRLDKVYARAGNFATMQARLKQHMGARYLALEYLLPEARQKAQYRDLLRARNRVAALMRALLYKRLESSVAAFRSTLDVLSASNRNFRSALDRGFVPIGRTASTMLAGAAFDADQLLERLESEERRRQAADAPRRHLVHSVMDFDLTRWQADLDADFAVLQEVITGVARITPDDDDKLRALRHFLARPEVAAGKVLIFSEAEATVNYLFAQLNPGGSDPAIARLSGANMEQIQHVITRFAPAANLGAAEAMPGPPIQILIATDVVSEGQNLQDCNRVLNYDLHWNPVRLIQRFGRVDRIGTTHPRIFLHNTWPDTDVDAGLNLTERLNNRIRAFHDFIGLDAPLLSSSERLNPGAMYRIYDQRELPPGDDVLDEVAVFERGAALLRKLQQDDPQLWQRITALPDGIRSALPTRPPPAYQPIADYQQTLPGLPAQQPLVIASSLPELPPSPLDGPRAGETVVLFQHGDRSAAYAVGADCAPRSLALGQFITALECAPGAAAAPLPPDTNARVMAAYAATRQEAAGRLGRARRPGGDSRLRRYLSRELRAARESRREQPEHLRRIAVLQEIFLTHLPATVLAELDDVRRLELTGDDLIRRLEALRQRHRLSPPDPDDDTANPPAAEVVRTICSEGLVSDRTDVGTLR